MRSYMPALYGNAQAKDSLGHAVENNTLPHAIIIEGPRGSGKKTLARQIVASQLCENRTNASMPLPCCRCRACNLVLHDNAVDVMRISRGEKSTLGVDAVREAKQDMFLSSTEFDYKFYIFEDAHTMTVQAQNALLIVLEEPPPQVKIILLCESADALLTTVRSRARLIRMNRFSFEEIEEWLGEHKPLDIARYRQKNDVLRAILTEADGCIGAALALMDPKAEEEFLKERQTADLLLRAMASRSFTELCSAFSHLPTKRDELINSLTFFLRALRDLILAKRTNDFPLCYFTSTEDAVQNSRSFRISTLLHASEDTESAIRQLERNANTATVLNVLKCALKNG